MGGRLYDGFHRFASRRRTMRLFAGCLACVTLFQVRGFFTPCCPKKPAATPAHAGKPDCACDPKVCELPDSRMSGYDAEELKAYFAAIGPSGRHLYAWTQLTLDVAFPLLYAAFLVALTIRLYPRGPGRWAVWLPVAAAAADLGENLLLALMAWDVRAAWDWVGLASILTSIKGAALLVTVVGLTAVGAWRPDEPRDGTAA